MTIQAISTAAIVYAGTARPPTLSANGIKLWDATFAQNAVRTKNVMTSIVVMASRALPTVPAAIPPGNGGVPPGNNNVPPANPTLPAGTTTTNTTPPPAGGNGGKNTGGLKNP